MRNATYMKRGFTLIEVLTTIVIIGILVSLTTYVYNSSLIRSRDGQRKTDLGTIKNALEQYYLDNRSYPSENLVKGPIYNAKWQLEDWSPSGTGCPSTQVSRKYLAPFYLGTIPEDPQFRLPLTGGCPSLEGNNLFGEYLYFVNKKDETAPKSGYYLFARMESSKNYNLVGDEETVIGGSGWGYDLSGLQFCTSGQSCTHTYQVRSDRN